MQDIGIFLASNKSNDQINIIINECMNNLYNNAIIIYTDNRTKCHTEYEFTLQDYLDKYNDIDVSFLINTINEPHEKFGINVESSLIFNRTFYNYKSDEDQMRNFCKNNLIPYSQNIQVSCAKKFAMIVTIKNQKPFIFKYNNYIDCINYNKQDLNINIENKIITMLQNATNSSRDTFIEYILIWNNKWYVSAIIDFLKKPIIDKQNNLHHQVYKSVAEYLNKL